MGRFFTEEEIEEIRLACQLAHGAQTVFNDNDNSDSYLILGEFGWKEPFHICPHERPGFLAIEPLDQPFTYPICEN